MAQQLRPIPQPAIGPNGVPYAGAKLHVYEVGTTTPVSLYSDEDMTTPLANPMIASASGLFPVAFLAETKVKQSLYTSTDVLIDSWDVVYTASLTGALSADLVSFDGSEVGFASTNVQDAIEESIAEPVPLGSTSTPGRVQLATVSEVRSAATGNKAIVAEHMSSAYAPVTLTDAATIAIDWKAGLSFEVTIDGNRTLGNPTNGIPGTWRTVIVKGAGATDRGLDFGNQYFGPPDGIDDLTQDDWAILLIYCVSANHFTVFWKPALGEPIEV